jgi:hypothetical protein
MSLMATTAATYGGNSAKRPPLTASLTRKRATSELLT